MINFSDNKNYLMILLTSLFFISCLQQKTVKGQGVKYSKNYILTCDKELICYKFLYNDDDAIQVNEKRFWGYGKVYKEFAYKKLDASFDDMVKSIKTFDKKEDIKDFYYTYAFVNNCNDTLYAEYDLKKWIIKENGKSFFYEYDKSKNRTKDTLSTWD